MVALNGSAAIQLELGTPYTEQGATAADACAGNLTVTTTGTVDINTPGDYTVTYTATDPANNVGTATRVVTVVADNTPPEITAVAAVDITTTTARLTWTTDEPSDSTVNYGLDLTYGTVVADPILATAHAIDLANLTPGTTYYYSVASRDAAGNSTANYAHTFTTASAVNYDAYVIQDPTLTAGGLGPEGFAATLEQDGVGQTITEVSAAARLAAVYTLRHAGNPRANHRPYPESHRNLDRP